ncbi:MAG: site-2 protease family protein [Phycisphaerales bacterium]|nr:site-2 protease family protein [Phycisphaerales bacterium]
MRGSLRLIRVFGIDIAVHWTFLLLIAWIVFRAYSAGARGAAVVSAVLFVLAIFVCVVLHELGHALTARRFGVQTRHITLLPIGGVAALERIPTVPVQELLITIAGPLVNVAIAATLVVFVRLFGDFSMPTWLPAEVPLGFLGQLAAANLVLFVFNLLPAFPMDGGRILRSLLAMWLEYGRATAIAANVGAVTAVGFVAWGLFGHEPLLVLVAVFVYLGGQAEASAAAQRTAMRGATVGEAMVREFRTLREDTTVGDAADVLLAGSQQDFPVVDREERLVGMLFRGRLVRAAAGGDRAAPIREILDRDGPVVDEGQDLAAAIELLRSAGPAAPVVRGGRVVGLLTTENVGEFLMVRGAVRG